jgi:hypothetical protein
MWVNSNTPKLEHVSIMKSNHARLRGGATRLQYGGTTTAIIP